MEIKERIKQQPLLIFSLSNPSNELIEIAVREDIRLLNYFMNDELYDKFKFEEDSIVCLDRLSDRKLKNIIMMNPSEIKKVSNPSDQLQIVAVKRQPILVFSLKNPSIHVWRTVLESEPMYIKYIESPIQELQMLAITKSIRTLEFIKKPTKVIQRYVIKHYPEYVHILKQVDDDVCLETLKKYGLDAVLMFNNISDTVRQFLFNQSPK